MTATPAQGAIPADQSGPCDRCPDPSECGLCAQCALGLPAASSSAIPADLLQRLTHVRDTLHEQPVMTADLVALIGAAVSALAATPQPAEPHRQTWKCSQCGATSGEACNAAGCFLNEAEPPASQPASATSEAPLHLGATLDDEGYLHATVMRKEANGDVTVLYADKIRVERMRGHDVVVSIAAEAPQEAAQGQAMREALGRRTAMMHGDEAAHYAPDETWVCLRFNDYVDAKNVRELLRAYGDAALAQPVAARAGALSDEQIAKFVGMLANRIAQPHYVKWVIEQAIAADRALASLPAATAEAVGIVAEDSNGSLYGRLTCEVGTIDEGALLYTRPTATSGQQGATGDAVSAPLTQGDGHRHTQPE